MLGNSSYRERKNVSEKNYKEKMSQKGIMAKKKRFTVTKENAIT
jgi:hypothetical protein